MSLVNKVDLPAASKLHARIASSDSIDCFSVESETSNELIARFNDKHLDFRVSVLSQEDHVSLATWVHPHNIGGRLYLKSIMPFHIIIARNALARVHSQG